MTLLEIRVTIKLLLMGSYSRDSLLIGRAKAYLKSGAYMYGDAGDDV